MVRQMDLKIHRTAVLKQNISEASSKNIRIRHSIFWMVWMLSCLVLLSGCSKKQPELSEVIKKTAAYQLQTVERPESASIGGEWTVLSVLGSGEEIPDSYGEIYLSNLKKRLKEQDGVLSVEKYTEYARAVLALAQLGEDPEEVDGYDLLAPLLELERVTAQGINGAAFALMAIDAAKPEIAVIQTKESDAELEAGTDEGSDMEKSISVESKTASDRIKEAKTELLAWILDRELPNGGFALIEEEKTQADADITAMVLQALAPYRELEEAAKVIDRGVNVLAQMQGEDGMYESWGEKSSETVAQVMLALSVLEIDCETDVRFVKEDKGLYDVLLSFYDGNGGFAHVQDGETDPMATDQALCALNAYQNFKEKSTASHE